MLLLKPLGGTLFPLSLSLTHSCSPSLFPSPDESALRQVASSVLKVNHVLVRDQAALSSFCCVVSDFQIESGFTSLFPTTAQTRFVVLVVVVDVCSVRSLRIACVCVCLFVSSDGALRVANRKLNPGAAQHTLQPPRFNAAPIFRRPLYPLSCRCVCAFAFLNF